MLPMGLWLRYLSIDFIDYRNITDKTKIRRVFILDNNTRFDKLSSRVKFQKAILYGSRVKSRSPFGVCAVCRQSVGEVKSVSEN